MEIRILDKNRVINSTVLNRQNSSKVLIIAPAIGVARNFYREIAYYFYNLSYSVIYFDYHGMLDQKSFSNNYYLKLSDWGYKDIDAVIQFALNKFPDKELYFLGHSIAGQVFPLAKSSSKIKGAFFVASQNASYKNWNGALKLKVNIFWHILIPVYTKIYGYLPAFVYGGKYDLHKFIAKDWARWGKNKNGILGVETSAFMKYKDINLPIKFLSFSDDKMLAPLKSVEHLYDSYGSPYKLHEHIRPEKVGLDEIGHFNFFKKKCAFLWPNIDFWFNHISSN